METPIGKTHATKIFNRLDIAKHILCILIAVLKDSDNFCLITFSQKSQIVYELTKMTKQNKIKAFHCIHSIKTYCNKYMSQALQLGYNEIKKAPSNHIKSIILLTDGHDTAGDDMVLHMFDRIQKPEKTQLNTFGFSNEIKSSCLEKLAKQGGGIFCFIPDQSMIGTIFINFLANTFLTFAQDVYIDLSDNNFEFEFADQPKKFSLQYGQKRYFTIRKKNPNYNGLPSLKIGLDKTNMIELKPSLNSNAFSDTEIEQQNSRNEMLKFVSDNRLPKVDLDSYNGIKTIKTKEFLNEFQSVDGENNPNHEQLKLSLQYWNTWGAHYLKSFAFAHWFEQCLNFKSPSMRIYKYDDFDKLVDEFTDIFCTLPPPEASAKRCVVEQLNNKIHNISFSNIMNMYGGCILETCKIKMKNGWKQINKVKKGDRVECGAIVKCVIKMRFKGSMIQIGKLIITPYHPIFYQNNWIFPKNVPVSQKVDLINFEREIIVYNLVLDNTHFINVEGLNCITLGHGIENGVLKHQYYGTDKVLKDFAQFKGWEEGFISVKKFDVERDENSLVCKTIVYEYDN
jgi:hypothetical protein